MDGVETPSRIEPLDTGSLARREDFRLGHALIRPALRRLEGRAGTAAVEPLVMQVLLALVDARGGVLTRDDLIRRCWKGQIVGDDSVNRAIKEVRRAARESDAGFTVETIPRTGYRIAERPEPAELRHPLITIEQAGKAGVPAASRRTLIGASLALTAGGLGWWLTRPGPDDQVTRLMDRSRSIMSAGTPEKESEAIGLLEEAVTKAPQRADAWGLLALTRARASEHLTVAPEAPLQDVSEAAERALAIDPDNADAQAALALAMPYYGDWLAAERRYDAAIARHPEHLYVRDSRCFFLGAVGRMRESAEARLAFADRAPLDANLHFRNTYCLWFLNRIDEADRSASLGLEMWPRHPGNWFSRLWILASTGRLDRAGAHVAHTAGRPALPPPVFDTLELAIAAADGGSAAQTAAAITAVMNGARSSVTAVVNAMMLLHLLSATDQAFALAEGYYLERGPFLAATEWRPGQPQVPDQRRRKTNMLFVPSAAAMQRDPRFLSLVERMGLGDYWRRSGTTPDFLRAVTG